MLFDVMDGPLPPGDTPAPPRLLPMWDSVLLAFADRSRVIDEADRPIVTARNGDTLPTFLVDGRVAGLWWAEAEPGGRTRIVLEPFGSLSPRDRTALRGRGRAPGGVRGAARTGGLRAVPWDTRPALANDWLIPLGRRCHGPVTGHAAGR